MRVNGWGPPLWGLGIDPKITMGTGIWMENLQGLGIEQLEITMGTGDGGKCFTGNGDLPQSILRGCYITFH